MRKRSRQWDFVSAVREVEEAVDRTLTFEEIEDREAIGDDDPDIGRGFGDIADFEREDDAVRDTVRQVLREMTGEE